MRRSARLCALILTLTLLVPQGAMAASFPDLSPSHWAYGNLDRAVQLGILYGMEDGRLAPDETLTWGQYLVMLDRTFYPDSYAAATAAGSAWDQAGYLTAVEEGLIHSDDFLPVQPDQLGQPILRQDAAVLLSRMLAQQTGGDAPAAPTGQFSDWDSLSLPYQQAVAHLSGLSIVRGREDGSFGGPSEIRRADGSVLLLRTLDAVQEEEKDPGSEEDANPPEDFFYDILHFQGEYEEKHVLLFGSPDKRRFDSREEAAAAMTTITTPVWHLDRNGNKVPATASLVIHAAIAEDVKALFTEIYNDPEQFPIHDIGGYSWRGDTATGEHNCGTAIDVNSNENYQVREGQAMVGSFWSPGENPYSISPDGSVVRIFAQHGWSWGGDAWAADSDQTYGYHDYMHFSYMGM